MNEKRILLVGEVQRDYAQQVLSRTKIDHEHPIEVVFRPSKERRSLDQNALFHLWVRLIRQHLIDSRGTYLSEEAIKEWLKSVLLGTHEVEINGITRTVAIPTSSLPRKKQPDGSPSMAQFMEDVDHYCSSELGLYLPTGDQL